MHSKIQRAVFILLCGAGAGLTQTVYYGVSDRCYYPRYPVWWHDNDGYPYEYRCCTVGVSDRLPPVRPPEKLEAVKKFPVDDPLRVRQEKRMAVIDSTHFVNTNTLPMEVVPGLTPQN